MFKRKIFLLFMFSFFVKNTFCQQVSFFKDFSFYKMKGVDSINRNKVDLSIETNKGKSNFVVKCVYDNKANLVGIYAISKVTWQALLDMTYIGVTKKQDRYLLFLGSGKTRSGYTRALFQKKIFVSDSTIVINDTLIYKSTRNNNHVDIKIFTKINSDSISYKEMSFAFNKSDKLKNSPLTSFDNYKTWFALENNAYEILGGLILLKQDPIMKWQKNKVKGYLNLIDVKRSDLEHGSSMPISFFWLKDSGLLY